MDSVQQLQHLLTDEHIGSILIQGSTSSLTANQVLVNCLIEKVENKASILEFCEHLEKIKKSPKLQNTVDNLRKGLGFKCVHNYVN